MKALVPKTGVLRAPNSYVRGFAWALVIGGLGALLFGAGFWIQGRNALFLTTTSPNATYTVHLKGDKSRPLIMRNEVRANVVKLGQPFVSSIWLHSTEDLFDLSFEAGFPDSRWLADNIVEFYTATYAVAGVDLLSVENRASKPIKYLRIESESKFLLFEIPSESSVSLDIPAARGDSRWIALQGVFSDGIEIPFNSQSLGTSSRRREQSTYQVSVGESTTKIQVKD